MRKLSVGVTARTKRALGAAAVAGAAAAVPSGPTKNVTPLLIPAGVVTVTV